MLYIITNYCYIVDCCVVVDYNEEVEWVRTRIMILSLVFFMKLGDIVDDIYRKIPILEDYRIQCPFCSSKLQYSVKPVYEVWPNGEFEKSQARLMECYSCRLHFINKKLLYEYEEMSEICTLETFEITYKDTRQTVKEKALAQHKVVDKQDGDIDYGPFCDFEHKFNQTERRLTEEILKKYDAPISTIGIVFYEMPQHPKEQLRRAYIVSDKKSENTNKKNSYFVKHAYSEVIFNCISLGEKQFTYQDQIRKLHYFYGNKEFYGKLKAYKNISLINNATFDELVEICVYYGKGLCTKHYEQMEIVTAKIIGTRVKVPQDLQVYFCPKCDEYYINYDYYREFVIRNGIPPIRLIDKNDRNYGSDYYSSLNEESILAIYGYKVGGALQNKPKVRQRLLEDLIDMELIKKVQIISHIEWLIKLRPEAYNAQACWRSDLEHIRNYRKNRQRLVQGVFKAGKNKTGKS